MARRGYTLGARAEATAERRARVFEAAYALFASRPYEDITLQAVAERAGVSLKTVVRLVGSKSKLATGAARWGAGRERARRTVEPGDVTGAVRVLRDRYEEISAMVLRRIALEERIPDLRTAANVARKSHLAWLGEVFARWLPARPGPERKRRLLALFGATELYVWWSWRRQLDASRADAEAAMHTTLTALVAQWSKT